MMADADSSSADTALILELLTAFRRSKTMFAAVELGIFDLLEPQPQSVDTLATKLAADPSALARLLDACRGLGLLTKQGDRYANSSAASTYLTSGSERRMTGYIRYSNDVMWKLWANLEGAVREGTHRWQQTYGWDGPIFSHFFRTEQAKREFLMGMHGFGVISSPHVVRAFDLSRFRRLADLGAATGHLAIAACEAWPQLSAVALDLPDAVPLAQEIVGQSAVSARIDVVAGDFFVDALPPADLYAVGRILHDWSLEKVLRLLRRIYDALPSGGALLVVEKLLADDKTGPVWAQMQNLNMLTCTEGQERTLAEYEELLRGVGFRQVTGRVTTAPADAILAEK